MRLLTIELGEDRAGLPRFDELVQRFLLDAGRSAQDHQGRFGVADVTPRAISRSDSRASARGDIESFVAKEVDLTQRSSVRREGGRRLRRKQDHHHDASAQLHGPLEE